MNRVATIVGGFVVGVGVVFFWLAAAGSAAAQDPAQLQAELEKARAIIQAHQAQQAQLQAELEKSRAMMRALQAERDQLQSQLTALQDQTRKLASELADLKAQRSGGSATPAETKGLPGKSMQSKGTAPPKTAGRKAPPKAEDVVPKVDGIVTAVSGKDLAEISLGSDDGLRKGHRLEVYRIVDGQGIYVGRIEVMKTTPNKSVGKAFGENNRPIQKGDRVVSKL
jgi:hypothetical protein